MGIRSAKDAIREARCKAGLTQEDLSDGICSLQSLSRIETGMSGVSPATFQALMERAGAPCERYPVFASRDDFDCFYALKHARFYLDAWQLTPAWQELQKLENRNWADNKLYYQEWLLLHSRLQYRSYCGTHDQIFHLLLEALHITRPSIVLSDFHPLLLTQNEVQLLIALSQEAFHLGQNETCLQICTQIKTYLSNSHFTAPEQEHMLAENAIVHAKYLLSEGNFHAALKAADTCRHQMAVNVDTVSLFELTFLTGLCYHYIGNADAANLHIKAAFYSAYAVDSCYATICRKILRNETDFPLPDYMRNLPDIPLTKYLVKMPSDTLCLSDGTYNIDSTEAYTLGRLIQDLRQEQHVSQDELCLGLCSKSKLSKMENGKLQPNIILAETMLQRLGVSERIFTFWGNEKDAKFYDLRFKLIHHQIITKEARKNYLLEMEQRMNQRNTLYYQTYLTFKAMQSDSPKDRIALLTKALELTIPNFDVHQIHHYRLSWVELSLLNNIAHEYRRTDESDLSTLYFLQIVSYVKKTEPDILFQSTFLPNTYYMYCHSLYMRKLHHDTVALHHKIDLPLLKTSMNAYGGYLFSYSQALGECARFDDAVWSAAQACALHTIMELHKNASALKKFFYEDFSLELMY